ncbi:DUF6896 domain-containing protein [Rhizobium sp. NLR22b]|uniref:DUF6896 domain-containing protein n=1 Tax=Rhizobium sp. NLR22b TaxID=2731115 RepID=UPI001C83D9D5|nr:hypothetical protein [Rhizobium sp. NLR22b]MBX5242719.1 hypothetical protein [Rhizobium sp. NLR22b]
MTIYSLKIHELLNLQHKLLSAFTRNYPEANDFTSLLNFPRSGALVVDGERWNFVKHGLGLRFVREEPVPQLVVDMHDQLGNYDKVDWWRLTLFLESMGISIGRIEAEQAVLEHDRRTQ